MKRFFLLEALFFAAIFIGCGEFKAEINEYTVTFDTQGGDYCSPKTEKEGTVITLPVTARTGCTFNGWYAMAVGGQRYGGAGSEYAVVSEITMYAQWMQNSGYYTVTFDTQGGPKYSPITEKEGSSINLPAPSRDGYTFNGWYDATSGGNRYGGGESSYTISGDVKMYAQWTAVGGGEIGNYTLNVGVNTASGGGASYSPKKTAYAFGEQVTVTAEAKDGYAFIGWSGAETSVANPITVTMDGDKTLTANFQPNDGSIIVSGSGLADKLAWLNRSAQSHNTYIIEASADENISPYTFQYSGAINITVIIRGDGANRTVRLSSNAVMFTVKTNVTLILDNNITLHGHSQNTNTMVSVDGGIFIMNNGSAIIGNIRTASNSAAGAVYVSSGIFEMNGGAISGNAANSGGAVYITSSGTFTMSGGEISDNTAGSGGGVYKYAGTFEMTGGVISGNAASEGGGVYISSYSGANAMRGGVITGNTASEYGGGVYIGSSGAFTKTGGTITGYNSDQNSGNVVKDVENVLARRGHAVYASSTRRKETTAGPDMNLSSGSGEGWDD